MKLTCPKCKSKYFWQLSDGRFKCCRCKSRFSRPKVLNRQILKQIISEFLLEHSTNVILSRVKISKRKLLEILTLLRVVMAKDLPNIFEGIVEVDETYLGGQMKNKRKKEKAKLGKNRRGFGTIKQPTFGILCREGQVWAEIVAGIESKDLEPLIEKQVRKGSTVCSDTWRGYTGLAAKGYVHRLVKHNQKQYSDKRGGHINGLEGFWGYLKRKLAAKGGIRRSRLPLYLGEYVWRYNHRKLSLKEQGNILIKLFFKH